MYCTRCHGLMAKDYLLDMKGAFGEMWATSWRCMNCGAISDAIVTQNRVVPQECEPLLTSGASEPLQDDTYLGWEAFIRPAA